MTRHSSHADLVCRALEAGKAVFVEKPLALTMEQLDRCPAARWTPPATTASWWDSTGVLPRCSPRCAPVSACPGAPPCARYLVNAGPLSADSWYGNEDLEGSRFAGRGWPFHRHLDLVDRLLTPSKSQPWPMATAPICRSSSATPTARWPVSPMSRTATPASRRRRLKPPAAAAVRASTTSSAPQYGPGAGGDPTGRSARPTKDSRAKSTPS